MFPKTLDRRINRLFTFHLLFVFTLIGTAAIGLSFSLKALFEPFRSCPVLNIGFILFWFYAVVSACQLCLGLSTLSALGVRSWKSRHSATKSNPNNPGHLVDVKSLFVGRSRHMIGKSFQNNSQLQASYERVSRTCCCVNTGKCSDQTGWLQSITVLATALILGHMTTFIWSCSLQQELVGNRSTFPSRIMNLFIEAKVQSLEPQKTGSMSAAECWVRVQHELECCGPTNYTDWLVYNSTSQYDKLEDLPKSCFCSHQPVVCNQSNVIQVVDRYLYTDGCTHFLTLRMQRHSIALIIIAPFCTILLFITFLSDLIYTLRTAYMIVIYTENSACCVDAVKSEADDEDDATNSDSSFS
ncbi:hypothetical protein PHET_02287 [Paragonimus heterotremus]|uniref:Tetraspanin n=1 Tax=Paragonimus heterotremus TaxID=100268 RepID=A0A8J4WTZ1_9TREM|nr:hypothetical protein PHET_02287 [Paragonimus heterotremus]